MEREFLYLEKEIGLFKFYNFGDNIMKCDSLEEVRENIDNIMIKL